MLYKFENSKIRIVAVFFNQPWTEVMLWIICELRINGWDKQEEENVLKKNQHYGQRNSRIMVCSVINLKIPRFEL